jgi:hypothetical protein
MLAHATEFKKYIIQPRHDAGSAVVNYDHKTASMNIKCMLALFSQSIQAPDRKQKLIRVHPENSKRKGANLSCESARHQKSVNLRHIIYR